MLLYRHTDSGCEVLLGRRRHNPFKDHWTVPGGGVNSDPATGLRETPLAAALRETAEETGIDVGNIPKDAALPKTRVFLPGIFSFHTFIAPIPAEANPRPVQEFTDLEWFPLSRPPRPLHIGVRSSLRKLKRHLQ